MSEHQNTKDLYIPVNVPDSDDYIAGIALFEISVLAISMVIALIAGGTVFSITGNSIIAVAIAAFIISFTLILVRRDSYNENFIKKMSIVRNYYKSQKQFVYRFINIYEITDDGENL